MRQRDKLRELREIHNAELSPALQQAPVGVRSELQLRKWRLIHKYVHANPFATNETVPRSEQWRRVVDYVRDIGDMELLDWVLQQVEIARHIEQGIRDMRPRKKGPCHPLLLEYVGNRKRKALAVHHWALAAGERGPRLRQSAVAAARARLAQPEEFGESC